MTDKFFHLFKIQMGSFPKVTRTVKLQALMDACQFYHSQGDAFAYVTAGKVGEDNHDVTNAIYISAIEMTKTHFKILFVRGDPGRAMPSLVNMKTREVRVIEAKDDADVPGASCHLIISKQEIAEGGGGRHRTVMELTKGIGKTLARDFLADLMFRFSEDHLEDFTVEKVKTKKGEKTEHVKYRPTVRFHPQMNANLQNDLVNGKIGGFRLMRGSAQFTGEANAPEMRKLDVQLHAVISPTNDYSAVKKLVSRVQEAISGVDFVDMKLELVDEEGNAAVNPKSIKLEDMDENNMRYCRRVPVYGLGDKVAECCDKIDQTMIKEAKKIMSTQSYWE